MRSTGLVFSSTATKACDRLPSNTGRQSLIDSLIEAYGLHEKCQLVSVVPATAKDLGAFHSSDYIEAVMSQETEDDTNLAKQESSVDSKIIFSGSEAESSDSQFGLQFDCPRFAGLSEYVKYTAGSSLSAASWLTAHEPSSIQHVAINWYGGRHHGGKASASGFCYVNDVVLAILRLRTKFRSVFYLDLDIHHGDGVENAFRFSKAVTTCSVHRHDIGFFPGTGESSSRGCYNVPTRRGLSDKSLHTIMDEYVIPLIASENSQMIVIQCGCDGLASDPKGDWNLTIKGLAEAVMKVVNQFESCSVLLLGGGGYNHTEAAKFFAYVTKCVVGDESEWDEIPQHEHVDAYQPDMFSFWTSTNLSGKAARRDENKKELFGSQ